MTRNWDAEWQQLSSAQDKAFQELRKAMAIVTGMSLGQGDPSEEQMDRAKTTRKAWEASMRQMNVWLDEWWAAHGGRD